MRTVTIKITGKTQSDIDLALDEASRLIRNGFLAGHDQNDTGSYGFCAEGDIEEPEEDPVEAQMRREEDDWSFLNSDRELEG